MDRKSLKLLTFLVIFLVPPSAWARTDLIPGSRYTSARGAAMGDAFIPIADDGAGALFYNPAALAKIRGLNVEVMNLSIQSNMDYIGGPLASKPQIASLNGYFATLKTEPTTYPSFGVALCPNYSMNGLAFGALAQTALSATYRDGYVTYRSQYEFVPAVGGGINLAKGIIRLGLVGQWVNKTVASRTVHQSETLGYTEGAKEGSALSLNTGFAFTLPFEYLPSVQLVGRNIGGAKYRSFGLVKMASNTEGVPDTEKMSVDASVSLQPRISGPSYMNLVFEMRDMFNSSSTAILGRAALGIEFSIRDFLFLRTGFSGGYLAAGFGLRRPKGEFALSYFSEEAGRQYMGREDRKIMFHYQARIF